MGFTRKEITSASLELSNICNMTCNYHPTTLENYEKVKN